MIKQIHKFPTAMRALVALFCAIQIVLYALMHLATNVIDSKIPSFLCVLLCLMFAVFLSKPNAYCQLAVLALIFTLCADYFLVLYNDYFLTAMIFFNITQLFYAARVYLLSSKKQRTIQLCVRIGAIALMQVVAYSIAKDMFDLLVFVSVIYFCNLATSAVFSCFYIKKQPLQAIGLLLFLLCDICVWANNASSYMNMPNFFLFLTSLNINIMWVFYAPSQALLALSTIQTPATPLARLGQGATF